MNKFTAAFKAMPRQGMNFYANYAAGLFTGVAVGIFFATVLKTTPTEWNPWPFWIVGIVVCLMLLIGFYLLGNLMAGFFGQKAVEAFVDGYLPNILTGVTATYFVIAKDWINENPVGHGGISILACALTFFIVAQVHLKLKKKLNKSLRNTKTVAAKQMKKQGTGRR